ncbi:MAG: biopolymer transporter ExbD [Kiritimatiellia bacterium]|jgi:biopolymer transport protein ExbD
MAGGGVSADGERCEIALGPMIDCFMLLLLYYISCSKLEQIRFSKDVVLPVPRLGQGIKEENAVGRFLVDIEWNENLNEATFKAGSDKLASPGELVNLIKKAARLSPRNFRVVIRADRQTPFEFTQQVMAAVAEADVPNMMISTKDRGGQEQAALKEAGR